MRTLALALALTACGSEPPTTTDSGATNSDSGVVADSGDSGGSGLFGLQRYCQAYKDCGGTYYATAQDCVDASLDYWGSCPSRRDALDTFGECMADVSCDSYNPDTYNPNNTECSAQWSAIAQANAC